jgi:hypothetical protein
MSTIIAGLFENIEQAQDAQESLRRHGFAAADVCHFANNPPGQHDQFPIGGDESSDPGARGAQAGTIAGAGAGAGVGAAVGAVVGGPPGAAIGAGVGAYVGSLAGTLSQLEGKGSDSRPLRRPAGVMVAARADGVQAEQTAIAVLRAEGAQPVERAQGQWSGGKWADFDAVSVPQIVPPAEAQAAILPQTPLSESDPVYRVQRVGDKWQAELGSPARRQTLDLRQQAVSLAISEAENQPRAVVEVYGKDGGLVWREFYDAASQQHSRMGRT